MIPVSVILGIGQFVLSGVFQLIQQGQKARADREKALLKQSAQDMTEQEALHKYHRGGWMMPTVVIILVVTAFPLPMILVALKPDLQILQSYRELIPGGIFSSDTEAVRHVITTGTIILGDLLYISTLMAMGHIFGASTARWARRK